MPALPQSSNNYRFYQYVLILLQKIPTRSQNALLLKKHHSQHKKRITKTILSERTTHLIFPHDTKH